MQATLNSDKDPQLDKNQPDTDIDDVLMKMNS